MGNNGMNGWNMNPIEFVIYKFMQLFLYWIYNFCINIFSDILSAFLVHNNFHIHTCIILNVKNRINLNEKNNCQIINVKL